MLFKVDNREEVKNKITQFIQSCCPGAIPLLLVVKGSQAYGTNVETSDIDYGGVYAQRIEDIIGNNYIPHIVKEAPNTDGKNNQDKSDKEDKAYFELQKFLNMLTSNNPTVMELLYTPEDCVIYKHPVMNMILSKRDSFITKRCGDSFSGFAKAQMMKAVNMNRMQMMEMKEIKRLTPMDFCYIIDAERSIPLKNWMEQQGIENKNCGLSKVSHSGELFTLYVDETSNGKYGFKGICGPRSTSLKLSAIPKSATANGFCYLLYNQNEYVKHCAKYKKYTDWLKNRNTDRWVEVKGHGQKIDGKNMLHCRRLTKMAVEIAEGKGVIIRRPDREELLDIRRGKVNLEELVKKSEADINKIKKLFSNSNLPDEISEKDMNKLLVQMRKSLYNI